MTFEDHRTHLRAVAYRVLGTVADADDAVQEAWLRYDRTDTSDVENLAGWLTTVVSRVALNMLRARKTTASLDEVAGLAGPLPAFGISPSTDPAAAAELADSVGQALLVVLETLAPAERLAFVLHDLFAVPFDEVATILGRSPGAARQLASRARRRVQGASPTSRHSQHRAIVDAFLAASKGGDLSALVALLDPGVVVRADAAAAAMGTAVPAAGRDSVGAFFDGRARAVVACDVDGEPGGVWQLRGVPQVVFGFTIVDGLITEIALCAEPQSLALVE